MNYQKIGVKFVGLALLLGLTTSIVGCETTELEEGDETAPTEQPVETEPLPAEGETEEETEAE